MNRKILSAIIICILTVNVLSAQENIENIRVTQLFNFGWKFRAGELKDAQAVDYDDNDWRVVDLPHDFQLEQPWDKLAILRPDRTAGTVKIKATVDGLKTDEKTLLAN